MGLIIHDNESSVVANHSQVCTPTGHSALPPHTHKHTHSLGLGFPFSTKGARLEFLGASSSPPLCNSVRPQLVPSRSSLILACQLGASFRLYIFHLKQRGVKFCSIPKTARRADNPAVRNAALAPSVNSFPN